jgi:hypothetical protein
VRQARRWAPAFAGVTLVLAALPLAAQMYKWKDANGQVHFTQTPPKAGVAYEAIGPAPPPAAAPNQDALNQQLQRAQKDAPKQAETAAQAEQAAAQRQEACRKALERIAYLDARGQRRLATTDEKGQATRFTAEEFNRQRAAEEEIVRKNCE